MEHQGTVFLETPRLMLRRFTPEDAEPAFRNWCSDDAVTRFLTWPTHSSIDVTRRVLNDWISHYGEPDYYQWAIVLKENGEPIGSISVVRHDDSSGIAHIGYCISQSRWGQGYTTEAFRRVIAFLFEDVKVSRIESYHDPNNPASGRVMEKCGLQKEGIHRKAERSNQGIVDACVHAMLAEDYFAYKGKE